MIYDFVILEDATGADIKTKKNQEAVDELQYAIDLIKQDGKDWLDERDIPVLEMAISALQSEWEEMIVICDNCGHAIHVKKEGK